MISFKNSNAKFLKGVDFRTILIVKAKLINKKNVYILAENCKIYFCPYN
jgi:hypothetical protein